MLSLHVDSAIKCYDLTEIVASLAPPNLYFSLELQAVIEIKADILYTFGRVSDALVEVPDFDCGQ